MARKRKTIVPDIQYNEGQNLFNINSSPKLPKYTSGLINDVNGWAGGSKAENVSQVSEVIKQFREGNPEGSLEEWISFHKGLEGTDIEVVKGKGKNKRRETVKMAGIEQGVLDIMNKMKEVKNNINQITEEEVRSWLKNLVYEKTYCGLEAQKLILKHIAEKKGFDWMLGSIEDEKQGIDGYVIDPNGPRFFPLQIKSSSYNDEHKQEHFRCPVITYKLCEEGINYDVPQDAFREPASDTTEWNEVRDHIANRYRQTNRKG